MPSVLETLFQDVHSRLSAIKGNSAYHYGLTLKTVEREILEPDGAQMQVNTLAPPCILIQRGQNVSESGVVGETVDEWTRRQEFRILFKLASANDAQVGEAIEDMMRALFQDDRGPGRSQEWSVETEDPETRIRHPGPLLVFSTVYSEEIGDPSTGT